MGSQYKLFRISLIIILILYFLVYGTEFVSFDVQSMKFLIQSLFFFHSCFRIDLAYLNSPTT